MTFDFFVRHTLESLKNMIQQISDLTAAVDSLKTEQAAQLEYDSKLLSNIADLTAAIQAASGSLSPEDLSAITKATQDITDIVASNQARIAPVPAA